LLWLLRHHINFVAQQPISGGRGELGGSIADFVIYDTVPPIYLRIQGTYWHSKREQKAKDMIDKEYLEALGYRVIDLWENRISQNIDRVMEAAMAGEELGE
jgi:very-short-patch-repair endonuclease